jgi:hypothetical protein
VTWITRARPKTDRIACPWLIATFIDPAAEIRYVPADQVLDEAQRQDATSFDAAPESGGQLFLAGKPHFMESVIADDPATGTPPAPNSSTTPKPCAASRPCGTKTLRGQSADLEFTGSLCNLRDAGLGIAAGSAAKTAALHSIDCRCQTRAATAAANSASSRPTTPSPCPCP